ncbi:diguanylate cyclase (plasmid) [Agrobacterium sp. MA01]|uniref:GGDEF domain-containing protein n=1 Tax=Agrobacterium sp. MA01 TaxID=2664893 RepID=UPI00129B40FB|nr:sensor domain-containing diguanylate cyclase [Agrobacterium sp. MA01]QGG93404.1 diguanylate cyclase [Agrobacterium sp. MA01]
MTDTSSKPYSEIMAGDVFRKVAMEIADGVIGMSKDGIIRFANPAAEEIFGWRPGDLIGKRLDVLLPDRVRRNHDALVAGFRAGLVETRRMGQRGNGILGRRADGSEVNLGITILKTEADGEPLLIAVVRDVSEVVKQQEELKKLAETDFLTGLMNRRAFFERASFLVEEQGVGSHSVIIFDLDHFKSINDRFGHQTGDRVLTLFSTLLRQEVRPADLAARYGGEEFIALCRGTTRAEAIEIAESVAEQTRKQCFFGVAGRPISITVSAGVATLDHDLDDTLRRADAALYEAKHAGRDRVSAAA